MTRSDTALPLTLLALSLLAACATTTKPPAEDRSTSDSAPPKVVEPEVPRRVVHRFIPNLGNYEVGAFAGATSVESFGMNPSFGVNAGLYASEDFFLRLDAGQTTVSNNNYGQVSQYGFVPLTSSDARKLTFEDISVGYNFLPGEAFFGRNIALNTAFYVIGGVGVVKFLDRTKLAENIGAGFKVFATDHVNINFEVNDRLFSSEALGYTKNTNNIELRIGINRVF